MSTTPKRESAKAAQAFRDYVALGADRSLEALAAKYQSSTEPTPTTHLRTLKGWSTDFGWQSRIAGAVNAATERMLEASAELDADSFLETSRLLNRVVKAAMSGKADLAPADIVRIREAVRKPKARAEMEVKIHFDDYVDLVANEHGLVGFEREELKRQVKTYFERKGVILNEHRREQVRKFNGNDQA